MELVSFSGLLTAWCFAAGFLLLFPFGTWMVKLTISIGLAFVGLNATQFSGSPIQLGASFALGFAASLPLVVALSGASSLGELIEAGRGMTIGSIVDPAQVFPELPLAAFMRNLLLFVLGSAGVFLDRKIGLMKLLGSWDLSDLIRSSSEAAFKGYIHFLEPVVFFLSMYILVEFFLTSLGKVIPSLSLQLESFILKGFCAYLLCEFFLPQLSSFVPL